jgi:uncharacterized 2Fe-2S/4Fe-4S cluster protein (DUF4445 family)
VRGKMLKISKNSNIVEEILKSDLKIEFPCAGKGKCGKCKIKLLSGDVNVVSKTEKNLLSRDELQKDIRLACMLEAKSDIIISVPEKTDSINKNKLKTNLGAKYRDFILGIDLGTTTIEIQVYDAKSLKKIESIKVLNPQAKYGADILSRLKYYSESVEKANQISLRVINLINSLDIIDQCSKIYIAGNTAMQLILAKQDISDLLYPPFEVTTKKSLIYEAKEIGLNMKKNGTIQFFPVIESYIGGDIYSGFAYYLSKHPNADHELLIDIGTNAELVYITKDRYYVASTPAGPAFEGGSISCGMRAEQGALKKLEIDMDLDYEVIGDVDLIGICGSSLIQSVAELRYNEFIDETGRLNKNNSLFPNLEKNIREEKFYITDKVFLSQEDIREFQLAKAAIRGAIDTLLEMLDIEIEKIRKIVISGNFGKSLSKKSLINLGILPRIETEKIKFAKNLVIQGLDEEIQKSTLIKNEEKILSKIEHISLADTEKFKKNYIKSINF